MATPEHRGQAGAERYRRIGAACAYKVENVLMPLRTRYEYDNECDIADVNTGNARRDDKQQQMHFAEWQRAQHEQCRERGRR